MRGRGFSCVGDYLERVRVYKVHLCARAVTESRLGTAVKLSAGALRWQVSLQVDVSTCSNSGLANASCDFLLLWWVGQSVLVWFFAPKCQPEKEVECTIRIYEQE